MHKITAFIVVETTRPKKGKKEAALAPLVKSAPHYFEKSVPAQFIVGHESTVIGDHTIELTAKSYPPDVLLVEGTIDSEDVFAEGTLDLKEKLLDACYQFAKKKGAKDEPTEEYTVYQISEYKGDPELFLKTQSQRIAGLLKSEKLTLDEKEIEHTLSFQFKYAKDDLVIIDWDGAFIFDPNGEFGEIVELFELANYQLLRYRMLDIDLDERLHKISKMAEKANQRWRFFGTREIGQAYQEVIKLRSQSISEFEALDRDIKLIGDWYLARLYDLATKKFKLEEWRVSVKEKLESLEDVYSIISENFSISSAQIVDMVQAVGWLVLLVGYFVLFFLESKGIKW